MIGAFETLARAALRAMEPETAHRATILAMRAAPPFRPPPDDPRLAARVFGLDFPNPVGMAAGFDKNAEVVDATLALGFGFTEIGTLTPRPQPGNPRPRLFRLPADKGVINRFGFNSEGHAPAHRRLIARRARGGVVGVNIGANKDAVDRIADYAAGVAAFSDVASYFTINVSSPNTPGLRDLQHAAALSDLLARVLDARDRARARRPVLLKIAPDLTLGELDAIVRVAAARGVDGMIVSNTTVARPATMRDPRRNETGGLSGKPLFDLSTRMLGATFARVERRFPLIGVGGVDSAAAACAKIEAGASLVQLYSALVYEGAGLVARIKNGLSATLSRENLDLADLVGRAAPRE